MALVEWLCGLCHYSQKDKRGMASADHAPLKGAPKAISSNAINELEARNLSEAMAQKVV